MTKMRWRLIAQLSEVSFFGLLLTSSVNLIVARSIGSSARGELAKMTLALIVLQIVSEGGILGAVTHFSRRFEGKSFDLVKRVRNFILSRVLLVIIPITGICVFVLNWLTVNQMLLLAFTQILVTFFQVNVFYLQGINIESWNRTNIYQSVCYSVAALFLVLHETHVVFILMAYNLSYMAPGLTAKIKLSKFNLTNTETLTEVEFLTLQEYSKKNFWWIVANQLLNRIDLLIFAVVLAINDLGVYSVALSWAMLSSPIFQAIGSIGFVQATDLEHEERRTYLFSMISKYVVVSIVAITPIVFSGFLMANYFLGLEYIRVSQLLPPVFLFVATKLLIQAIAQVLRSGEQMKESILIQLAFCVVVTLSIAISLLARTSFLSLLYAIAIGCIVYTLIVLFFLRGYR